MRVTSFIFLLTTILLLNACKSKLELVSSAKTDSLVVTERYVDRVVIVPGDSVKVSIPILMHDTVFVPQQVEVKGRRSSVRVEVTEAGTIEAQANCDEYEAQVAVLERTVERYETEAYTYKEKESGLKRTIEKLKKAVTLIVFGFVALLALRYFLKPISTVFKPAFNWIKNCLKHLKTE